MATFSDTRPLQYGEFVQTMPYKEANQLGLYKQQLYDQNIQKIYSGIEQTAALPLSSDVDKQYLQESLNNLQTSLKKLNTADFSRNQVVNSVAGMTSKIAKDKYIQAGVRSTMFIQSETERRKALEKEGKTDADNDMWFYDNVNKYTQRQQLAENDGSPISFNMEYTPYTDIMKLTREALVNAGESASLAEILFITDPQTGKPKMFTEQRVNPTTGKIENVPTGYRYADVKTIESLSSNKDNVMAAISNVLSRGDVKKQLQISGYATYKGVSPEVLFEPMKKNYEKAAVDIEAKRMEVTALLNAKNITPEERQELTKLESDLKLEYQNNDNEYQRFKQQILTDPDGFKQNLYASQFSNNMLRIYTKQKSEKKTGTNEGKQQQNWNQEFNFKQDNERFNRGMENAKLGLLADTNKRQWMEFYRDSEFNSQTGQWNKRETSSKKEKVVTQDARYTGGAPGDEPDNITKFQTTVDNLQNQKNTTGLQIYADYYRKLVNNPNVSDDKIQQHVNKYAKALGLSKEVFLENFVHDMQTKFKEKGLQFTAADQYNMDVFNGVSKTLTTTLLNDKRIKDKVANETGFSEEDLKQLKPVTLNFRGDGILGAFENNKVTLNSKDQQDVYLWMKSREIGSNSQIKKQGELAGERLKRKGVSLFQLTGLQTSYDIFNKFEKTNAKKYVERYNQELGNVMGVNNVFASSLSEGTDEFKQAQGRLFAYLNSGQRNFGDYSEEDVRKALADAKSINWNATSPSNQFEDWNGEIVITDKDGKPFKITQLRRVDLETTTGKEFVNNSEKPITTLIRNSPTNSTNLSTYTTDPNAWKSSYFKTYEANPTIKEKGYQYHADVVLVNGKYQLINYIKTPMTNGKFLRIEQPTFYTNEESAENAFKSVTPAIIDNTVSQFLKK